MDDLSSRQQAVAKLLSESADDTGDKLQALESKLTLKLSVLEVNNFSLIERA